MRNYQRPARPCSVNGCVKNAHALGRCIMHHRRWQVSGDPGPPGTIRRRWSAEEDRRLLDATPPYGVRCPLGTHPEIAIILERSVPAVASRLKMLRRREWHAAKASAMARHS